jgi:predicted membrane protein
LQVVAQRLDTLEQTIEQEYQANIGEIDRSVKSQLEILGYKENAIQGETILTKLWLSALFTFLAAGGWWLMTVGNSFLWWIGLVWGLIMLVMVVSTIILPTLNQASEQKLRPIREKAEADKLNATKDRDRQLATIKRTKKSGLSSFDRCQAR